MKEGSSLIIEYHRKAELYIKANHDKDFFSYYHYKQLIENEFGKMNDEFDLHLAWDKAWIDFIVERGNSVKTICRMLNRRINEITGVSPEEFDDILKSYGFMRISNEKSEGA